MSTPYREAIIHYGHGYQHQPAKKENVKAMPDFLPEPRELAKRFLHKSQPTIHVQVPEKAFSSTQSQQSAPYVYASFLTYHTPCAGDIKTVIKKPNSKWSTSLFSLLGGSFKQKPRYDIESLGQTNFVVAPPRPSRPPTPGKSISFTQSVSCTIKSSVLTSDANWTTLARSSNTVAGLQTDPVFCHDIRSSTPTVSATPSTSVSLSGYSSSLDCGANSTTLSPLVSGPVSVEISRMMPSKTNLEISPGNTLTYVEHSGDRAKVYRGPPRQGTSKAATKSSKRASGLRPLVLPTYLLQKDIPTSAYLKTPQEYLVDPFELLPRSNAQRVHR